MFAIKAPSQMFDWVIEMIEIFKVKLRWSKSLRLLQHVAFLILNCYEKSNFEHGDIRVLLTW